MAAGIYTLLEREEIGVGRECFVHVISYSQHSGREPSRASFEVSVRKVEGSTSTAQGTYEGEFRWARGFE